jgi:hypothetical protein
MSKRIFGSVSGGLTSAFMARHLKDLPKDKYEVRFGMANTGMENEETLIFADRCDREWGLGLAWIEALVHHGEDRASTHKVVSFETASRNGEPFEEVIRKYGIPNAAYLHCTRELKENPIRSYINSELGWEPGSYRMAIGIRADEPRRLNPKPERVYPLAQTPNLFYEPEFLHMYATKPIINDWWDEQPFRLNLKDYEGNCKTCFKKSTPKLVRIAQEHPDRFEFTARMEAKYGLAGHNEDGNKRVFYRGNMSTNGLLDLASISKLPPVREYPDEFSGCSESCEAFG